MKRKTAYILILLLLLLIASCQDTFLITELVDGTSETSEDSGSPEDTDGSSETEVVNQADGTNGFLYFNTDLTLPLLYNSYNNDTEHNYQGALELGDVSFSNGDRLFLSVIAESNKAVPLHSDNTALKCYMVDKGESGEDWTVLSNYRPLYTVLITAETAFTGSIDIPATESTTSRNIALAIYSDAATEETALTIHSITITVE